MDSVYYDSLMNNFIKSFTISKIKIPLPQYLKKHGWLSYNDAIHMIWYLGKQQEYLLSLGYGIYGLELSDIVVMDGCKFFCINSDKVVEINKQGQLSFLKPFLPLDDYGFLAPEIMMINSLPSYADTNCFFYSLGLMVLYSMFGSREKEELDTIYGTKLYWCMFRLLKERCLLFV
jgi:hypothetical protein